MHIPYKSPYRTPGTGLTCISIRANSCSEVLPSDHVSLYPPRFMADSIILKSLPSPEVNLLCFTICTGFLSLCRSGIVKSLPELPRIALSDTLRLSDLGCLTSVIPPHTDEEELEQRDITEGPVLRQKLLYYYLYYRTKYFIEMLYN